MALLFVLKKIKNIHEILNLKLIKKYTRYLLKFFWISHAVTHTTNQGINGINALTVTCDYYSLFQNIFIDHGQKP